MPNVPFYGWDCLKAVEARLKAPENQLVLDNCAASFKTGESVLVRPGSWKVEDRYPVIGLELQSDDEPFAAGNYTKDIEVRLVIFTMIKKLTDPAISLEYVAKLSASVKAILNQPGRQEYFNINA